MYEAFEKESSQQGTLKVHVNQYALIKEAVFSGSMSLCLFNLDARGEDRWPCTQSASPNDLGALSESHRLVSTRREGTLCTKINGQVLKWDQTRLIS